MSLAHPGASPETEEKRPDGFLEDPLLPACRGLVAGSTGLQASETASLQGPDVPGQRRERPAWTPVLSAPPKMHKYVLHRLVPMAVMFGTERRGERRKGRGRGVTMSWDEP